MLRAAQPVEAPLQPAQADAALLEEPRELARLFLAGTRLHARTMREAGARLVDLPVYPFERQRHWIEPARRAVDLTPSGEHPILGRTIRAPGNTRRHESRLSLDRLPWLGEHRVNGTPA